MPRPPYFFYPVIEGGFAAAVDDAHLTAHLSDHCAGVGLTKGKNDLRFGEFGGPSRGLFHERFLVV